MSASPRAAPRARSVRWRRPVGPRPFRPRTHGALNDPDLADHLGMLLLHLGEVRENAAGVGQPADGHQEVGVGLRGVQG
jgi:hypothetical protein